jgi:ketosteroid isomerase-like protein
MLRCILFLAAACALSAQSGASAIENLDKSWEKAILNRDAGALEKLLADDLIYAHASGVIDTKASYIAKVREGKQQYKTLTAKKRVVRLYGDSAVTFAHVHVTGINPAGNFDDRVLMMHTWVKTKAGWQLAGHQTTKVVEFPK